MRCVAPQSLSVWGSVTRGDTGDPQAPGARPGPAAGGGGGGALAGAVFARDLPSERRCQPPGRRSGSRRCHGGPPRGGRTRRRGGGAGTPPAGRTPHPPAGAAHSPVCRERPGLVVRLPHAAFRRQESFKPLEY